jgi:hypothetical protein
MQTGQGKMRQSDRNRIERILQNIDTGFIPKELIMAASVRLRDGEIVELTPDEYEDLIDREIEMYQDDPYAESDIIEMRMMLDLEKINGLLNKYMRELNSAFK